MLGLDLGLAAAGRHAWWPEGARWAADFANQRYMRRADPIAAAAAFSFTRGSAKWAADRAGVWHEFAPDAPARTNAGISIEPAGANLVPNPGLAGAAVGVHGAGGSLPTGWYHNGPLTTEIMAVTTLLGLPALHVKAHGVAAGAFYELVTMPNTTPLEPSTAYSISLYTAMLTGAAPALELRQAASNDSLIGVNLLTPAANAEPGRSTLSLTTAAGTARARLRLSYSLTIGQPYLFEFLVAVPQIELSSKVTSPMLGARAADTLTLQFGDEDQRATLELDNGTQVELPAPATTLAVPLNLARPVLRRVVATPA